MTGGIHQIGSCFSFAEGGTSQTIALPAERPNSSLFASYRLTVREGTRC
jgi:hypothetical protein